MAGEKRLTGPIDEYELEVFTPPCDPGAPRFAAKAHLREDIHALMPFLNAILDGAEYNPAAPALRWRRRGHTIVFHRREIAVSNVADRDEAAEEIRELVELVNETWSRRDEIKPDFERHQRPTPMAIYALLPQTNCKQCGEPTCFAFALKLSASQRPLEVCPIILQPECADRLVELEKLVIGALWNGG